MEGDWAMKWTKITPQEARIWKKAAIRLGRAIIRYQESWASNHTDSTIAFAYKIVKKGKQ